MKYYFRLQFKMLNRQIIQLGISPLPGYLLSAVTFIAASIYLFYKTKFAVYVYLLFAFAFMASLNKSQRNDFLKSCFSRALCYKIRLVENLLLALPFVFFLLYKYFFTQAFVLLLLVPVAVLMNFRGKSFAVIPTPFYKKPFEFLTGFRKMFLVFFAAYALTIISIAVKNFNLGLFSMILCFLLCLSFYFEAENKFYVWIYPLKTRQFLFQKIKTAWLQASLLCLPVIVALGIFFPTHFYVIVGFYLLGYLFLLTIILAKYSAFPENVNLQQAILIALSLYLVPLLIVIVPYFYFQSVRKLDPILK
ncbi:MAG: ABC transporter permease [Bacteroidota bacterium]|nr:ABC transporter permease [Bacteroidota bacterium]